MPTAPDNRLTISVGVNAPQSRGIITEDKLPDASQIGILLDGYDGVNNTKFTASTQDGKQVWNTTSPVVLSETTGTLYAYYPYKDGTDLSTIPVDVTAANQTDYLYATPVSDININNNNAKVTLNHALANINLTILRGDYQGNGNITSVTVYSTAIGTGGTFNAAQESPAFTTVTGTNSFLEREVNLQLGNSTDIMVVPYNKNNYPINFIVEMDGNTYYAKTTNTKVESGKSYNYTFTVNGDNLNVVAVEVSEWENEMKDDLYSTKAEYVTLIYETTQANQRVEFQYSDYTWVQHCVKMVIDGVEVEPVGQYTFATVGEHEVKIVLRNALDFGISNIINCKRIIIPNSVTCISGFNEGYIVGEIHIGSGVKEITGWQGESNSYTVTIDENNPYFKIQDNFLIEKATNTLVRGFKGYDFNNFPSGIEKIASCAFNRHFNSGVINPIVPEGVKEIGSCFFSENNQYLGTLTLPSTLQVLDGSVASLSGFTKIICKAMVAPEGGATAFGDMYQEDGVLIVPTGATGYEEWMKNKYGYLGFLGWTIQYSDELLN